MDKLKTPSKVKKTGDGKKVTLLPDGKYTFLDGKLKKIPEDSSKKSDK